VRDKGAPARGVVPLVAPNLTVPRATEGPTAVVLALAWDGLGASPDGGFG